MYKKYNTAELIDAYQSMLDYSGKASTDMLNEIDNRGGLEVFKNEIAQRDQIQAEKKRISKEVFSLTSQETSLEFVRKLITSSLLSIEELDDIVAMKYREYIAYQKNKEITPKTIITGVTAAIVSALIGAIILILLFYFVTPVFLLFIPVIYILNYLIIHFITKQNRSNWVIFLITLIATIASFVLAFYFFLPTA